jgi:hypothetical protein
MVYVNDELIKFEVDRIKTSESLDKSSNNLAIFEKATNMRIELAEMQMSQNQKEFLL